MSMRTKNILVFGATGQIGQYIVDALLEAKKYSIAAFTSPNSRESKAEVFEKLEARGLKVIIGDVRNEKDVKAAYQGIDTVISAVGRPVLEDQINLLKWAEESGVQRFFPSEYGTDVEYRPESVNEKPHQLKLKVRKYIKDHVSRVSYTYLVTGPYSDMFFSSSTPDPGLENWDAQTKTARLAGDGNGKVSLTTMKDVGSLLVAALEHPEASHNKALKVNSFTTTPLEILKEFERQTGGGAWDSTYLPLDKMKSDEQKAWAEGLPSATSFTLRRIWAQGDTLYDERDNGKIGNPTVQTLEDAVRDSIAAQKQ